MEQNSTRAYPWFLLLGIHCNTDPWGLAGYTNWWKESVWTEYVASNSGNISHPSGCTDQLYIPNCA